MSKFCISKEMLAFLCLNQGLFGREKNACPVVLLMVLQVLFLEGIVSPIISWLLNHVSVSKFISGRLISPAQRED